MSDPMADDTGQRMELILYVDGMAPASQEGIRKIQSIADNELAGRVDLRIVDVHQHPELVREDNIIAVPTLLRKLPDPMRVLVGNLSRERILLALDVTVA